MVEKRSYEIQFIQCYLHNKEINIEECKYCDYYKGIVNNDYTIIKCLYDDEFGG